MVIFAVLALFAGNTLAARTLLQTTGLICAGAQGETLLCSCFHSFRLKMLTATFCHCMSNALCLLPA